MAETKHDDNGVPTITGVLNTDGATVTRVKANPTTHILDVSDGSSGSDLGNDNATRDNSGYPVMLATDASGNIIPLYVNSSGQLLTKST
jgi:hypothetical protein